MLNSGGVFPFQAPSLKDLIAGTKDFSKNYLYFKGSVPVEGRIVSQERLAWVFPPVFACKQDVRPSDYAVVCSGQNQHQQNQRLARPKSKGVQLGQKAAIYARVSTSDQSCDRQVSELTAFAERGDFDMIGIFKETASGTSANRSARNRLIDLAQARKVDAILVTELSR